MHVHDDFIHVYMKSYIISYYYRMSKLQFCSDSNYVAIFQLYSLPGKILFLASDWEFFWGKLGKKGIFWIGNGACIRPLLIEGKGPE